MEGDKSDLSVSVSVLSTESVSYVFFYCATLYVHARYMLLQLY